MATASVTAIAHVQRVAGNIILSDEAGFPTMSPSELEHTVRTVHEYRNGHTHTYTDHSGYHRYKLIHSQQIAKYACRKLKEQHTLDLANPRDLEISRKIDFILQDAQRHQDYRISAEEQLQQLTQFREFILQHSSISTVSDEDCHLPHGDTCWLARCGIVDGGQPGAPAKNVILISYLARSFLDSSITAMESFVKDIQEQEECHRSVCGRVCLWSSLTFPIGVVTIIVGIAIGGAAGAACAIGGTVLNIALIGYGSQRPWPAGCLESPPPSAFRTMG